MCKDSNRVVISVYIILLIVFASCRHEKFVPPDPQKTDSSNFPVAIAAIVQSNCATVGCHNVLSFQNAGGVRMDSWEHLLKGGNNGAVIVPFAPENSSLLYFINTDSNEGPRAYPVMPYNKFDPMRGDPLSAQEYLLMKDWVRNGAPDKNGTIPFASNAASRQKIYLTMQACDKIGVIDAATKVVMRYINVGKVPAIESPHCVRIDANGKYAYVSFLGGEYIQKIDVEKDEVIGEVFVGSGSWNVLHIADDGKQLMVSDWEDNGKLVLINTETMTVLPDFGGVFKRPHGIAANKAFTMFYVTSELENYIYKFSPSTAYFKKVPVDDGTRNLPRVIHEIIMTPDDSKYFITCQETAEVRVLDAVSDSLLAVIPVGFYPQELAISTTRPYIFVTCMEDNAAVSGYKGSVYAINYHTYQTTRIDGPFYQPHALIVDDKNGVLYIASRNANPNGPAPHHSSSCAGRNGYYHAYDLNNFTKLPKRYEVLPEPYSADVRFK